MRCVKLCPNSWHLSVAAFWRMRLRTLPCQDLWGRFPGGVTGDPDPRPECDHGHRRRAWNDSAKRCRDVKSKNEADATPETFQNSCRLERPLGNVLVCPINNPNIQGARGKSWPSVSARTVAVTRRFTRWSRSITLLVRSVFCYSFDFPTLKER